MSDKCKHGIRDTETNLPYCRRCDQEAASESAAPAGSATAKWTKPKSMWAYVTLDGQEAHCYTSQRKARGFWAEQSQSKRIKKVKVQWQNAEAHRSALTETVERKGNYEKSKQ